MEAPEQIAGVPILDIRRDQSDKSLLEIVTRSLQPVNGQPKTLPSLLLYDEKGLKLFEEITYLDEYYLTNAEIETLQTHASEIADRLPHGVRLVELGSGNLRKINILLQAFEKAKKEVEYYALDVSVPELKRTFSKLDTKAHKYVTFYALHGTYDDGLAWLARSDPKEKPIGVMTMGSSLGNFTRDEAAQFLLSFKKVLGPADFMLVGLDACQDPKRVFHAYNDAKHTTEKFYRNGLDRANLLLGYEAFRQEDWGIEGFYDERQNKHQASYVALASVKTKDFEFERGEKIHFEDAFKYSEEESDRLWQAVGLIPQMAFGNAKGDYHVHLLSPSIIDFPDQPTLYASSPIPSLDDWQRLWAAWDTVTKSMVPKEELLNKPIKLRNDLIFYLGHIPTFADIHFTKATTSQPTDPAYYATIFERGIDPDVDNPEVCHDHSEIPESWPPLKEILDYSYRVRARITESIQSGQAYTNRKLGRRLWISYEHEAMHLETFLYMLLQSERVLPPPGLQRPDFKKMAAEARSNRVENKWQRIPAAQIKVGLDDPENDLGPDRYFGWDNERPARTVTVPAFEAQSRPISNGEYAHFLESTHYEFLPASWITVKGATADVANGINGTHSHLNGADKSPSVLKMPSDSFVQGKAVRTVYGPVPLEDVLDWPVMASYDELVAYARWSHGRIPTMEEVRSLYHHVEIKKRDAEKVSTLISAVNGHLLNEGVEETPPPNGFSSGDANGNTPRLRPTDLYIDLSGCNVGFKSWHPTAVTGRGGELCGQSDLGGLWEWTSTPLAPYDGFKAMDIYPGYTADFFDGKHNICLGGSWATVPRISGRTTFVNWYQRSYPFVWCTARLVRDIA